MFYSVSAVHRSSEGGRISRRRALPRTPETNRSTPANCPTQGNEWCDSEEVVGALANRNIAFGA